MTGYKSLKNALLSATAIATVALFGATPSSALVISSGDVAVTESGVLVPPPSTADPTVDGSVRIGDTVAGQIDVTAGSTLQVNEHAVPFISSDGVLFSGARIHVGDEGQGTLNLSGASTVNVSSVSSPDGAVLSVSNIPGTTTGGPSAAGFLNVDNSTVNITGENLAGFNVGLDGSGTAVFQNSSSLNVTSTGAGVNAAINVGRFGHGATPSSSLTLDGVGTTATVTSSENALIFVGRETNGTMNVQNGASVQMNGTRDNILQVGDNIGGNGLLQIDSGGTVTSRLGIVGDDVGSTGRINVDGAGSRLDFIGQDTVDDSRASIQVGDDGTGRLDITNGGTVEINAATVPGRVSSINVGGGLFSPPGAGDGTVNVDGSGSELRLRSDGLAFVQVGREGIGRMNVTNGGSVVVDDPDKLGQFRIGQGSLSTGTVTVDGTGSSVDAGSSTRVGISGTGTLNITDGGTFESTEFLTATGSGSTGNATVSGVGSTLNLLGVDGQGDGAVALIGLNGQSVMNVNSGGTVNIDASSETVTNLNGGLIVGGSSGASGTGNGTVNVDGAGATVNVVHSNATQQIGRNGTGALNITNGGKVTNAAGDSIAVVGRTANSVGNVNVTGAGSEWQAGSDLFIGTDVNFSTRTAIGNGGQGTLNVANGGSVVSGEIVNAAGGTITGGGGTISGNITNDGGTIAAGNSPGLMNVFGNVGLLGGGSMEIELAGTVFDSGIPQFDYDRLDVSDNLSTTGTTEGTVDISAGAIFDIDFFGAFTAALGDTFDVIVADDITSVSLTSLIFDFTGAALATGLDWDIGIVSFGSGREALQLMVVAEQAAVSEPGTVLVIGLGIAGLVVLRRRKRA